MANYLVLSSTRSPLRYHTCVSIIVPFKTATKVFSTRLACGSSVTKNNQGLDEIVVQGDVSDDIYDIILETWPEVPEESLEFVEDKKKK